ncbi:Ig-like domain-containing protein [Alicyclobacillus macrosporangiidus]|uniref:Ig-like domain-containing protein n=1 Tax=Alicyclobacillus macrosporangiidus TaxID=392015 RepID=UPI0026F1E2E4|nr:Ig-like domain-containing protein [Alicyclobacillus macrosporangiidus]
MSISAEVPIICPASPLVRTIPAPTGSTLLVGSTRTYTTIQDALNAANNGDRLLLDPETFTITSTINVNKSVTIEGQGIGLTTVITTLNTVTTMFNVTVSNVVFQNMSIVQNFPEVLSVESVISINNLSATGIYVDHCEISVCELGISIKATEFQITNCRFTYAPLASRPNGYFYIIISSTSGQSIIDNNTFVSDAGNTNCRFIIITNISVSSGTLQGSLLISNNTQLPSPFTLRHLLVMEEYVGTNFELFIVNNTTISEGNVPVLLFNADFTIFKFIAVYSNHVQNTAGKGLIGIDSSSTGTTDVFSSQNIIANQFFTAGWASATVPFSYIVGYNATVIPVNPSLPLIDCTLCIVPNITLDITLLDPCTFGIRGTVTCSGVPVPGATVSFASSVAGTGSVFITPNPATTDASGNFTATMTTSSGTVGIVTVIASTTVNGIPVSNTQSTPVNCPLLPNDVTEECIRVDKVYDWVVISDVECFTFPFSCAAIAPFTITACSVTAASATITSLTPSACTVNGVSLSLATLLVTAVASVGVAGAHGTSCTITGTNTVTDCVCLCVPTSVGTFSATIPTPVVFFSTCTATLIPNTTSPTAVIVTANLCKEVEVIVPGVKLAVLAKFCQPRPNVTTPFTCPPFMFPSQCPTVFPIPNCTCQATALATGTITATVPAGVSGTATLNADICPDCDPQFSTVDFTFSNTSDPTAAFTFTATAVNPPTNPTGDTCTTVHVTGIGTQTFTGLTTPSVPQGVAFDLLLTSSPTAMYRLVLSTDTGMVVFDSGSQSTMLPTNTVLVKTTPCKQFPSPV